MPLDAADDEGPDRDSHEFDRRRATLGRRHSASRWVGTADGYEIKAAGAKDLDVRLMRSAKRLRPRIARSHAAANVAAPPIHTRSEWLAREPKTKPSLGDVQLAFVHHTVSANGYSADEVPDMFRGMQAFHMDTNGWDDIGYNFLVDRFGRVWEGRAGGVAESVIGAQTEGFNSVSTGVAVIGTFSDTGPPAAVTDALIRLLAWKLPNHGVDPGARATVTSKGNDRYADGSTASFDAVAAHRDAKATACPGHIVGALPHIRNEASAQAANIGAYAQVFRGGVYLATGQFDFDETPEIVTGAGETGGPHVRTFDPDGRLRTSFFAFTPGFTGGVRVATANVDALSADELILGAGPGGGPHVRVVTDQQRRPWPRSWPTHPVSPGVSTWRAATSTGCPATRSSREPARAVGRRCASSGPTAPCWHSGSPTPKRFAAGSASRRLTSTGTASTRS